MWRMIFQLTVTLCITLGGLTQAMADMMSLPEQQAEAQRLKSLCQQDRNYIQWLQQAQSGSIRATYMASAAMIQCFYNNVDSRYPTDQKQKWLDAIEANKQKADQLQ